MKQSIILLLYGMCILSCHSRPSGSQETEKTRDTIFVSYRQGIYETSIATHCSDVKEVAQEHDISEVIVIDKESYDTIYSYMSAINVSDKRKDSYYCEARIFVQVSGYEMCIGTPLCGCDANGNDAPTDNYVFYLIRSLSGYYNYLDSLDLQFDPLINEFGIPSNYQKRICPKIVIMGSPNEYGECEMVEFVLNEKGEYVEESEYDDFRKVALVKR